MSRLKTVKLLKRFVILFSYGNASVLICFHQPAGKGTALELRWAQNPMFTVLTDRRMTALMAITQFDWPFLCALWSQASLMSYRINFVPAPSCFPPPVPVEYQTRPLFHNLRFFMDTLSAHCRSPGTAWGQTLLDLSLVSVLMQLKRKNKEILLWKIF